MLETVLLCIYNHDSAIASAASRMTAMAGEPAVHRDGLAAYPRMAAVAAARAAYIAGFAPRPTWRPGGATACRPGDRGARVHPAARHRAGGVRAQIARSARTPRCWSTPTTSSRRCGSAVELTGAGSARSGSTPATSACWPARCARQLDALGATETRIIVTSDLDEYAIAALPAAPVDGYGVGTSLVTGSGHPTCGFVYKLVARAESDDPDAPLVPVAKKSTDKVSIGGRKYAVRRLDAEGDRRGRADRHRRGRADDRDDRALLVPLVRAGEIVGDETLRRPRPPPAVRAELPMEALKMSRGEPVIETIFSGSGAAGRGPKSRSLRTVGGATARKESRQMAFSSSVTVSQVYAEPTAMADVGRPEEPVGFGLDHLGLDPFRGGAPDRQTAVVVVVIQEHHEAGLAVDEEGRSAVAEASVTSGSGRQAARTRAITRSTSTGAKRLMPPLSRRRWAGRNRAVSPVVLGDWL